MTSAYYNEIDPFAAQWLRNLIAANLIVPGDVDERSIRDVQPTDLRGYHQCHFFAGIGGWSHALRCAGWPDDRPAWTGSCPCQPFSVAGSQRGTADERHLWPEFFRLIRECRPATVVGEQVAGPAALAWFDIVSADLEGEGYAVGAADLCAAGVGAPHIRQRLYWVGHASGTRGGRDAGAVPGAQAQSGGERLGARRVADEPVTASAVGVLANAAAGGQRIDGGAPRDAGHVAQREPARGMEHTAGEQVGLPGCARKPRSAASSLADPECGRSGTRWAGEADGTGTLELDRHGSTSGFWSNVVWLPCTDGKARPVESGTFPLAHGVSGRVGRLRAYGNALCEPVAQAFVEAVMECYP